LNGYDLVFLLVLRLDGGYNPSSHVGSLKDRYFKLRSLADS